MYRLGKVIHLSNSKNLILRPKIIPPVGVPAFNHELKQVGVVFDIFGPVNKPYASIKPRIENPRNYVGQTLYVLEEREGLKGVEENE